MTANLRVDFQLIDPRQVLADEAQRNNIGGVALFDGNHHGALYCHAKAAIVAATMRAIYVGG